MLRGIKPYLIQQNLDTILKNFARKRNQSSFGWYAFARDL